MTHFQATPRIKYLLHTKYLHSTFTGKYMTALILSLFQLTQADSKVSENFHNTNFTVQHKTGHSALYPFLQVYTTPFSCEECERE